MASVRIALFLILIINVKMYNAEENGLLTSLEDKLENKFSGFLRYIVGCLQDFNDRNLGDSEIGRFIHYNSLKPVYGETGREGKSMKKMSMALLPLVFHVGATSTWMLLTSLMAAKSVAIGLALLVFKIAVSSAKVASFFTTLKSKHHHDWSWNPHEHGHARNLKNVPHTQDWSSYIPESPHTDFQPYKTIPTYKASDSDTPAFDEVEYPGETKKRRS